MNKLMLFVLLTVLTIGFALYFYGKDEEQKQVLVESVLYVGPVTVECVGVSPQRCMQVREEEETEYKNFYGSISGFEFVPGYDYKLKVNKETIENPPADASSIKYSLVEVIEKSESSYIMIDSPKDMTVYKKGEVIKTEGKGRGLFEGNVVVQIIDPLENKVLAQEVTTLNAPDMGVEGNWSLDIKVPDNAPSKVKLAAMSPSPKDGSLEIYYSLPLEIK